MVLTASASDFLHIVWQPEDCYFTNDVCIKMCYCDSYFCLQGIAVWNDNAGVWAVQPDMSTAACSEILLEMGFTNENLNVLLLQRYDNDITKVVAELLT